METAVAAPPVRDDPLCWSRHVIQLLDDRWTVLVLGVLAERPARFGELRRELEGISQKMLTQTLRALERDGMLHRTVYPLPLAVEYALTPLGEETVAMLDVLRRWGVTHLPSVDAARAAYDERHPR